ncbi:MAG: MFS transporter [Candidatus Paceibacterota bacterium]|jgi:DHA1 family tetracycline resistance protein-like MFS transporter
MLARKNPLLPIITIVFIDLVGFGIVIPIFAPLLLDMHQTGILPPSYGVAFRNIILGFLLACYPIAQFFGSPILGGLSDRIGRKPIFLASLGGMLAGYLLTAIGIITASLPVIFLGRILSGFSGGSLSVAYSAIADISDERTKVRNFGLVGMMLGLGFIIGPFLGGKLSDPLVYSSFNYATPFLFSSILTFLNIILIYFQFEETLKTRIHRKISILTGFKNIEKAFHMENLRVIFIVIFLLSFGFAFFTQFFQVFLINKFEFTQSNLGNLFAYMGLCIALTQGLIVRPLSFKFAPVKILRFSTLLLGLTFPFLLLPDQAIYIYLIIPFISIWNGLTMPNYNAIVSNLADKESQGEILGINQSIQSLAQALPPILAGFAATISINLPILIAGAMSILAWLTFVLFFEERKKALFHEV